MRIPGDMETIENVKENACVEATPLIHSFIFYPRFARCHESYLLLSSVVGTPLCKTIHEPTLKPLLGLGRLATAPTTRRFPTIFGQAS